jgi:hypothetical protein
MTLQQIVDAINAKMPLLESGTTTLATLARFRDVAESAPVIADCPALVEPLGLSGVHRVETTVMDSAVDYYVPSFALTLTRPMSAWDVISTAAKRWARFPVMDNFAVSTLCLPPEMNAADWFGLILFADVDRLTDEELDAMPFEDEVPS